ncbi:hypothetical protein J2Z35_002593 [Acetoanaerobium pronyense]|uniref:Uncharacterized protein n=2 Tax=Acetoanaerobium pronyense TaxID=1482736 RepID=A0ABS4KLW3_9FIRM|nr:hypothetical protein [Acetoanaerobium pronyense]
MYNIETQNNKLFIDYKSIYDLYFDELGNEIKIYEYFSLPDLYRGFIEISNINNFIQDKKVLYEFRIEDYDGKFELLNGNILYNFTTDEKRILSPKLYELCNTIISYNKDENLNMDVPSQFDLLRKIKDSSEEVSIVLNQRLRDEQKPIIIDKIVVDFIDNGETLKIFPQLSEEGAVNLELLEKIDNHNEVLEFYTANINGENVKFVIKNKEALRKIKKNKELRGEDRLKVLSGDSELFQDDNIDLSRFGPRVTGIGYLSYRTYPDMRNNGDLNWGEEITEAPHFYVGSRKVILTPKLLPELEDKLKEMNEKNLKVVEIEILNEENESCKVILTDEQLKNEIQKIKNSIISPTEIKNKNMISDILDVYDEIPKDDKYIPINGKYVEKFDKEFFKNRIDELRNKNDGKKEKAKTLKVYENLKLAEYREDSENKSHMIKAEISSLLKENIDLFEYQKEALLKLQNLYQQSPLNGFLLCDDMGLGKTIQLLTFLGWLKEKNELSPSLVVAPKSLLNNWDNENGDGEIQKFFKRDSFKTMKISSKIKDSDIEKIKNSDIIFITYDSLRINNIMMGTIKWNVMICDEAQKIKNPQTLVTVATKAQNALFKIVCSATPIENSLIDLWNLVDYSKPGLLGSMKEFKTQYMKRIVDNNMDNLENINIELQNKISDFYIRREKEILPKSLPKKIIKIYKTRANQNELEAISQIVHTESNQLTLIQKLLTASNHVDLLSDNNALEDDVETIVNRSSKLKVLKEIMNEIKILDEKTIIFTRSIKLQHMLYRCIDSWYGIKPRIVNGKIDSLDKRTKLIDEFRRDNGFSAIILSPDVAGFGITLTEANHVIHFSRLWNPAKEDQATDRAYRIGQTKDVTVHYPILSFEEDNVYKYDDFFEYVENNMEINDGKLSPEEKLNILMARKKNMLLKFFLAVGNTDINHNEFFTFEKNEKNEKTPLSISDIQSNIIDAFEFETLISILLEREGYKTFLTSQSNDNGVDVVCFKNNELTLVQCKKVKKLKAIEVIKDLLYAKENYIKYLKMPKINLAIATNTTEIPDKILNNKDITLIDGDKINTLLKTYKVYKDEVDIKNEDRYSFERIKYELSELENNF